MTSSEKTPPRAEGLSRRTMIQGSAATAAGAFLGQGTIPAFGADPISDAVARLDAARAVPVFEPPGPPIDASAVAGSSLFYHAITFNVEIVQNLFAGVREAAESVGMTATSFDAAGDPSRYVSGFEQAINRGFDCILLESIQNSLVAAPMRRAIEQGIKVVMINEVMETGPDIPEPHAHVAFDYVGGAQLNADWVLADSGGKDINLVVFHAESLRHRHMAEAIRERIESACQGDCSVRFEQVNFADFATRLPGLTQTLLTSDPTINYMIPVIDGMSLNIVPGIRQAGASERVKLVSYNGTPSVLQYLERGEVVQSVVGGPHAWEGWLDVDRAIRVLLDEPVPAGETKPPNRLFDARNINEIDVSGSEAEWYNTAAAKDGFRKLWNVA